MEEEEVVFCATHRVNNILEQLFFQNEEKNKREEKKKKERKNKLNQKSIKVQYNDDEDIAEEMSDFESEQPSEEGDDEENFVSQQPRVSNNRQKLIGNKSTEISVRINHLTITKSEIPPEAKRVIDLITSSKELVHYVKLVRIE